MRSVILAKLRARAKALLTTLILLLFTPRLVRLPSPGAAWVLWADHSPHSLLPPALLPTVSLPPFHNLARQVLDLRSILAHRKVRSKVALAKGASSTLNIGAALEARPVSVLPGRTAPTEAAYTTVSLTCSTSFLTEFFRPGP